MMSFIVWLIIGINRWRTRSSDHARKRSDGHHHDDHPRNRRLDPRRPGELGNLGN